MAWDSENRLSYTRQEYNQLWQFYQQLREENEKLREACQTALDYLQEISEFDWDKDLIELIIEALEALKGK